MPTHIHNCAHQACGRTHAATDIVAEAARHCARNGLRLTEQRRAVLEHLANSPVPLGAYDLLDRSSPGAGPKRRLAPVAIYRALDFLLEAGLIHRLESRNAFIVCPHRHGSGESVIFLICESCGRVDETISDDIHKTLKGLAYTHGFALMGQTIELAGRCAECGERA